MSSSTLKPTKKHCDTRKIKLRAAAARTKGTPVRCSTGHADGVFADVTIADDTNVYRIAVPTTNAASGEIYEAIWMGTCDITVPSGNYTAGNGLKVLDGAIADSGSAATAFDDLSTNISFGVIAVGGTSVTKITATLTGDKFTATT